MRTRLTSHPSVNQINYQLRKWNLTKTKIPKETMEKICRRVEERKSKGKKTRVLFHGEPIPEADLIQKMKRIEPLRSWRVQEESFFDGKGKIFETREIAMKAKHDSREWKSGSHFKTVYECFITHDTGER